MLLFSARAKRQRIFESPNETESLVKGDSDVLAPVSTTVTQGSNHSYVQVTHKGISATHDNFIFLALCVAVIHWVIC